MPEFRITNYDVASASISPSKILSSSTADIITAAKNKTYSVGLQERWVSNFHEMEALGAQPWPYTKGINRVYIRYCYANLKTRDSAKCVFEQAIELWAEALGGKTSAISGHAISVNEARDDRNGRAMLCYEDPASTIWKKGMPEDVVVIRMPDTTGPDWATSGRYVLGEPGRHSLNIGRDHMGNPEPSKVAHEFGHVLGMLHEQNRNDRDQYMEYRCDRVKGFQAAYTRAKYDPPNAHFSDAQLRTALCEDREFATRYGFVFGPDFHKHNTEVSKEFDWDSIMLYGSSTGAQGDCNNNIEDCTMLRKTVDTATGKIQYSKFEGGSKPSKGDVEFVRLAYPYMEPSL